MASKEEVKKSVIKYFKESPSRSKYLKEGSLDKRIKKGVKMAHRKQIKKAVYDAMKDLNLTGREKAAYLATIKAETNFNVTKEKGYTVKNLLDMQKQFSELKGMSPKEIKKLHSKGQKAIYDKIYGGKRGKDLGNLPGEGYKFRGAGLFQTTGRHNISEASKELFPEAPDTLLKNPNLLNENYDVMRKQAANYWKKIRKKVDFSKEDAMDKVTDIVNKKTKSRAKRNLLFKEFLDKDTSSKELNEKTKGKSYKEIADEVSKFIE